MGDLQEIGNKGSCSGGKLVKREERRQKRREMCLFVGVWVDSKVLISKVYVLTWIIFCHRNES